MNRYWIAVGFGAFALLVIGVLVYGFMTHEEAGFIEGVPVWDKQQQIPLRIWTDTYATDGNRPASEDDQRAVRYAMETQNARLGFKAFSLGTAEQHHIHLILAAPQDETWKDAHGTSRITHRAGQPERCLLKTSNVPPGALSLVLQHELMHCLGFAHDCSRASIMCGGSCCTLEHKPGHMPPWITDHDVRLATERYGP